MKIILPRFRIKYSDAIEGILVEFRAYIFVKDINGQDEKLCGCCLFSYIYATKTDVHFEIVGDVSHKELIVIVRKVIDW